MKTHLLCLLWLGFALLSAAERRPTVIRLNASRLADNRTVESSSILRAPMLGFVSSGTSELRPMVGVPGSAFLGEPVALPDGTRRTYIAPSQQVTLLESAVGALISLFLSGERIGQATEIVGGLTSPTFVSFSPSGSIVVLYSALERRVQILKSNGNGLQVVQDIPDLALPSGEVRLIAIDDEGAAPVVGILNGSIYLVRAESSPQLIFSGQSVGNAAYGPRSRTLFIAESRPDAVRISSIRNTIDEPAAIVVNEFPSAGDSAIWMQASQDGRFLIVVTSRSEGFRLRLDDASLNRVDLPSPPTRLDRLLNGNSFLFSVSDTGPAWVLLGDEPDLQAVFVGRASGQDSDVR